jgi:hypothetical protein
MSACRFSCTDVLWGLQNKPLKRTLGRKMNELRGRRRGTTFNGSFRYRISTKLRKRLMPQRGFSRRLMGCLMGWAYMEKPACSGLTKTRIQYGSVRLKTGVSQVFKKNLPNGLGDDIRSHRDTDPWDRAVHLLKVHPMRRNFTAEEQITLHIFSVLALDGGKRSAFRSLLCTLVQDGPQTPPGCCSEEAPAVQSLHYLSYPGCITELTLYTSVLFWRPRLIICSICVSYGPMGNVSV